MWRFLHEGYDAFVTCTTPNVTVGPQSAACVPSKTCCQYQVTRTCGGDSYVLSGTCLGDSRTDTCLRNGAFQSTNSLNNPCSCDPADILALSNMLCVY